jgi:hypothetical protein
MKGVPTTSKYYKHFQDIQRQLIKADCDMKLGRPNRTLSSQVQKLQNYRQRKQQLELSLMKQAEYQAALKKQFDQMVRDLAKQNEILQPIVRELVHEEQDTIATKLHDDDPWVRYVAVHVAAKKWMPVEKDLITLLTDPYPAVRDAARQALVRLSRGNDFGPLPNALPVQVTQAQEQWQTWLDLQTTIRKPASYHE